MCNASPLQQAILQSINTHKVQDLENFLSLHNFELSCFLKHGINAELLNAINLDLLKKHVNEENITARELLEAGMSQTKVDEIFGEKPIDVVCAQCSKTFQTEEDFTNFKMFCSVCNNTPTPPSTDRYQQIRDNDQRANAKTIRSWIDSGEITIQGLIDQCGLSEDIARRLSTYYTNTMNDEGIDVKNLPPLISGRTDFYFIGMPAAGKTCLLASLLAYWEYLGIYNPDINNPRSLEYTDVLLEPFAQGYLPNRTDSGFLDYINGSLNIRLKGSGFFGRGETTRSIPINILDLAGEAWRKAAQGREGRAGLPDHRKYLDNQNEKAMLIVIDAGLDSDPAQVRNLGRIFSYFDDWKIWNKTASVGIIISKADKLTASMDYESLQAAAETFYNSPKCALLKNGIETRSRECRFEVNILPYSIGECRWGQFLLNPNYDSNNLLKESAEHLTEWILDNTGGDNSGGFGGLFSN